MKKILCLALVVLTMLCVFTGCSGSASIMRESGGAGANGSTGIGRSDQGNVSTSRDGTVNGRNRMGGGMFGGASGSNSGTGSSGNNASGGNSGTGSAGSGASGGAMSGAR